MDSFRTHFRVRRRTRSRGDCILYLRTYVHRVSLSRLTTPATADTELRSHLPLMFVGMEHIVLSNHALADEALFAANSMCDGDPLLKNEMGVMAYNHGK